MTVMNMFGTIDLRKGRGNGKIEKRSDDTFRIIKCGEQRLFVVESFWKELNDAIRSRFGNDAQTIPPRDASAKIQELSR